WWVLGGADAVEGISGVFGVSSDAGRWIEWVEDAVFLEDAVYLANGDLLACGSLAGEGATTRFGPRSGVILRSSDKGATTRFGPRSGVILRSSDKGANWSVTYKNTRVRRINAITALDPHRVWAVGEDGLIVKLDKGS